jgi:hypothetical protein
VPNQTTAALTAQEVGVVDQSHLTFMFPLRDGDDGARFRAGGRVTPDRRSRDAMPSAPGSRPCLGGQGTQPTFASLGGFEARIAALTGLGKGIWRVARMTGDGRPYLTAIGREACCFACTGG